MSRYIGQSDATFNTNARRLLLSNVIGIDNTGKTFLSLHLFYTSESKRLFCFVLEIWRTYFFYDDCPGPAVWCRDFAAGFTAAMAEQAAEHTAALRKAKLDTSSKAKERAHSDSLDLLQDPLPTAPPYEADSETIVVD